MGSCCGVSQQTPRSFLTKQERVALLKEYKADLDKESQGVAERIKELEKEYSRCPCPSPRAPNFLFFIFLIVVEFP